MEDIQAACELMQQSTNSVERMLSEFEREAATLRRDVQRELVYAEVEGPGLLWGSNPMAQPPTPRSAHACSHAPPCVAKHVTEAASSALSFHKHIWC